jgi:hypothetical protein
MTIQAPEPVGFVVTLKDVWDQVQGLAQEVHQVSGQLGIMTITLDTSARHGSDLESRVRTLETARARIYGMASLLAVLFGGSAAWLFHQFGR